MAGAEAHSALTAALGAADWPSARVALGRLIELHPAEPSLPFTLGSVLRNLYRTSREPSARLLLEADAAYRRAIELAPGHQQAAVELAVLAGEIERAAAASPTAVPAESRRSAEEVSALHRRALALQPSSAAVYRRLGEWASFLDDGRHEHLTDASDAYAAARVLDPTDARDALQLGLNEHKRGHWENATREYEAAIALEPEDAEAYALLGSLHLHRTRSLSSAESALSAAVALRRRAAGSGGGSSSGDGGEGEGEAVSSAAKATLRELVHVLQLQGRLDEARSLEQVSSSASSAVSTTAAAASSSASSSTASYAWSLQNELTLPMYIWRHRASFAADSELPSSEPLLALCGGLPASDSADGSLLGCAGACVTRATTVQLWQRCKRDLAWPSSLGAPLTPHAPALPGSPASEEGSRLHFAARWGAAREVRALLQPRAATETLESLLRPTGSVRFTPAHEAAIHADCDVMVALLDGVRERSPAALATLIDATDAFGRRPIDLIQATRPANAACLDDALRRAAATVAAAATEDGGDIEGDVEGSTASSSLLSASTIEAALARNEPPIAAAIPNAASPVAPTDIGGDDAWRGFDAGATLAPGRCDVDVWLAPQSVSDSIGHGGAASRRMLRLGARFVRDAVSLNKPLLLRGLLRSPRVLSEWSRSKLIGRGGDEALQVMQYEAGSAQLADAHTWRRVRLREWLHEMRNTTTHADSDVPRPLPEYIFDQSGAAGRGALGPSLQRLFPWRALLHAEAPGLYVGGDGSGNPFHYHAQTWNALVAGRKRWILYPPNASFYSEMHPREWLRENPEPALAGSPALECEQRTGDVLFVPHLWGHGTVNIGESVGAAFPFALRHGVDYAGALKM